MKYNALYNQIGTGAKRKRRDGDGSSDELSHILTKFVEVSEECDAKRRLMEAELEEKRREQERKHEERMMRMMMGFMQQMMGFYPPPPSQTQHPSPSFPPASPFPCISNFPHSSPFSPNHSFIPPSYNDSDDET